MEFFVGVVKTAIIMSRQTFWEFIFVIFSSFFCFWTLSWQFLDFCVKVWPLLSLLQATFPREKNIVGKLRKLFRASDVERFFLVFQQKKSVVVPNLLSTLYLSSGRLCAVCFSKFFKSSQIFAKIKWNFITFLQPCSDIVLKTALRMTVGKISGIFRTKDHFP